MLHIQARRTPLAPALLTPGRAALSYQALIDQIREAIDAINRFGFGRGDRVAVALPSGPECPAALAAVISGCVCVPLNPACSVSEFTSAFSNSRATALVTRSESVPDAIRAAKQTGTTVIELEPLPAEGAGRFRLGCSSASRSRRPGFSSAEDLAAIFMTSGSTSSPKIIPLTQSVICYRAFHARNILNLTSADRCLDLLPPFHGSAILISILGSLFVGAANICQGLVSTADFERCIEEVRPTWCALPPPFVESLLSGNSQKTRRRIPPGLRAFFTGGAPTSAETVEAIEREFGIPLQNFYGASECGGVAANPMPPGVRKRGSVGLSIAQEISILQTGEIAVRGPGVFSGYENGGGPDKTAFCGDWYRTGDLGYFDHDGYLFLTGRLGNVINRGGEKISPEEVEDVLRGHPVVRDAVVFPVPHEALGQQPAALIVPRTPREDLVDVNDVRHFVAQRLAAFKVPRAIVVVDTIPVGTVGKIQRSQLAAWFADELAAAARGSGGAPDLPRTQVERLLAEIWARLLGLDQVGIHDRFLDLGGNSLLAANMLTEVERKFGRGIPMASFWHAPTISNLAQVLVEADYKKCSVLLPVHAGGARPPLFVILPGWFVSEVELLSRYLGPDQPVYALIPDVRPGAGQSGLTRAEVVAECIAAMEAVEQTGPYFVMGRSVAGHVALDVAHALKSRGKTVALVALLDTHYPGVSRTGLLPTPLRQMEFLLGEFVGLPRSQWIAHLRRLPGRVARVAWRTLSGRRLPSQIANAALYTGLQRVFHEAPEPWPGRITFFAAEASKHRGFLDRRLYWSKAAGQGLEVHLTPGDHNMMVQEPHIREFSEALKECLDRARVGEERPLAARA